MRLLTHWVEEVPECVYAFWVCKPVIRYNTVPIFAHFVHCLLYSAKKMDNN